MRKRAAARIAMIVSSPIFCEIFLRWRVMPRRMLIIKAKSPPTKLGSSQVETRRLMWGSHPSSSSEARSGKIWSWMKPAMAMREVEMVRSVIRVFGVGGVTLELKGFWFIDGTLKVLCTFKVAGLDRGVGVLLFKVGVRIWYVAKNSRVYWRNLIR